MAIRKDLHFRLRRLTEDELDIAPKHYLREDGVQSVLCRHFNWILIFLDDDLENPIYYHRACELDHYRWGGIIKLGDSPISPQTEAHVNNLAQDDTTSVYRKISDNPVIYQQGSEAPFTEFSYWDGHCHIKEGNVLDLEGEFWPYALVADKESVFHSEYYILPIYFTGTYEGKQVRALGNIDRFFAPADKELTDQALKPGEYYTMGVYSGIRKDGRREACVGYIQGGKNGKGCAYYWLEGEELICSDEVYMETEWVRLPYLPKEDPTRTYKNIVWKFAGKEIHCNGKWGSKGFTASPRVSKVGYSHMFGPWYEGDTPYEHDVYFTFNENLSATYENLKEAGFKVEE